MIDIYCRGVNYWANSHYLPIEYYILGAKFDNWTKTDIYSFIREAVMR